MGKDLCGHQNNSTGCPSRPVYKKMELFMKHINKPPVVVPLPEKPKIEKVEKLKSIKIELKYYNGNPVIKKIKRISKPGIRKYSKISELNKPYGGLGISILSTPKGVMSDHQAIKNNVGGEILCEVF